MNSMMQLDSLMRAGDWRAADTLCRELVARQPDGSALWLAASRVAMALGDPHTALVRIERALSIEPQDSRLMMQRAQCLLAVGRRAESFAAADAAQRGAPHDPGIQDAAGTLYSFGHDQPRALAAYDAAVELAPRSPQLRYNRASVRRFLGDLAGAEQDYDAVIALRADDYEAVKNRTDLRTQTPQRNHVAQLERLAAQNIPDWRGAVQIGFALAKEYEDLGQYEQSFDQLTRAAARRRQHMKYDAATDVATVQWIIDAFPGTPAATGGAGAGAGASVSVRVNSEADAPIFVVGLPRSGTTVVERILSSHSTLVSAGELDCFAQALTSAVARQAPGARLSRQEMVRRAADVEFASLGQDYLLRARTEAAVAGRFIDKMPLNYLYCGLIRRALPQAKIVHLTRQPMAVCYAMYKTLFKDGYPFSYDLQEIAQYYVGYRRLMAHWQLTLPGQIHEVSYEALVSDQRTETRRLLEFCGLAWEEACARFHENPAPSTTASAVQVRKPVYDSSVAQWRHYARRLAPLREQLLAAGIDT